MNEKFTNQLQSRRVGHLFAGSGGRVLADLILGDVPVFAVEIELYCQQNLSARHKDGSLPFFPIYNDVRIFDGRPWRGVCDVLTGGFPCQDISCAGTGKGLEGRRSGLWNEFARIIGEIQPQRVEIENSPMLASPRGFRARLLEVVGSLFGKKRNKREITLRKRPDILRILEDLSQMGYNAEWGVIGAHHVGAPHKRDRVWIVATHSYQSIGSQRSARVTGGEEYRGGRKAKLDVSPSKCRGIWVSRGGVRNELWRRAWERSACDGFSHPSGERQLQSEKSNVKQWRRACDGGKKIRILSYALRNRRAWCWKAWQAQRQAGLCSRKRSDKKQCLSHFRNEQWIRELRENKQARSDGSYYRGGKTVNEGRQWWAAEPDVGRVVNGLAHRVDRLKALGNGQVPLVAAVAEESFGFENEEIV